MSKIIPLTQGQFTIVDDEDYEYLNKWKWQAYKPANSYRNYYALRRHRQNGIQQVIRMHNVLLPPTKGKQVDHKDGNSLNNCKSNLRHCTFAQNQYNRHPNINSSSKYKGVAWNKAVEKWQVYCGVIYYGVYENEEDAALKYNYEAKRKFGQFARLNIIGIEL